MNSLVTWNCNGAFRKKYSAVTKFDADLYFIQECEDPQFVKDNDMFHSTWVDYLWTGDSKNKGLGVFSSRSRLNRIPLNLEWRGRKLKHFILVEDEEGVKYLAVWTHKNDCEAFQYIGQLFLLIQQNPEIIRNTVIVGDFNSNTIWDSWDRWWNHTDIVTTLRDSGIESVYHSLSREEQGKETKKTLFHRKDQSNGYHIDYVFSPIRMLNATDKFMIGDSDDYIEQSDHVPLYWGWGKSSEDIHTLIPA